MVSLTSTFRGFVLILPTLGFLFAGTFSAWGQIALPKGYPHQCRLTNQEALLVLFGGKQVMVLESRFDLDTKKDVYGRPLVPEAEDFVLEPPDRLGWVIPVPEGAAPSDLPTDTILKDLHDLTHPSAKGKYRLRTGRPQGITRFGESVFATSGGVEEDRLEWEIFAASENAMSDLLERLAELELEGIDRKQVEDYAARGWGFALGVLRDPGIGGMLGPVAFEFETDRAVFPLRFQSQVGAFDLAIAILSDSVLDHRAMTKWGLRGVNAWENLHREAWFRGYTNLVDMRAPDSFAPYIERMTEAGATQEGISFYAWEGKDLNRAGRTTDRFKEDFSILGK